MAIPIAEKQFGQQVAQAAPAARTPTFVNDSNLYAAKAVMDAQEALGHSVTQGLNRVMNTVENAQRAVETTRMKEYQGKMTIGVHRAKREIEQEEEKQVASGGEMFTPEEYRDKFNTKVSALGDSLNGTYKFDWLRNEASTWQRTFTEGETEKYEQTVVHAKTVDRIGASLNTSANDAMEAAKLAMALGDAQGAVEALYRHEQVLQDPQQAIVRGGAMKHTMYVQQEREKARTTMLKSLTDEQLIELHKQYKADPDGFKMTPFGSYFGDRIADAETSHRVIKAMEHQDALARQAVVEQEKAWERGQRPLDLNLSDSFHAAALGQKAWNYNKQRDDINAAFERKDIGEGQRSQLIARLNQMDLTLQSREKKTDTGIGADPFPFGVTDGRDKKYMDETNRNALRGVAEGSIDVRRVDEMNLQHLEGRTRGPAGEVIMRGGDGYVSRPWFDSVLPRLNSKDPAVQNQAWTVMARMANTADGSAYLKKMDPAIFGAAVVYSQTRDAAAAGESLNNMRAAGPKEVQWRQEEFRENMSFTKRPDRYVDAMRNSVEYKGVKKFERSSLFESQLEDYVKTNFVNSGLDAENAIAHGVKHMWSAGWRIVERDGKMVTVKQPIEMYIPGMTSTEYNSAIAAIAEQNGMPKGSKLRLEARMLDSEDGTSRLVYYIEPFDPAYGRYRQTGQYISIDDFRTTLQADRVAAADAQRKKDMKKVEEEYQRTLNMPQMGDIIAP